ncbi:MAG: CheR family methyltransferase [Actinomycetota bacterium]|nr:MAG: chemotaxis protein methyltransferase [Actinomycetota bacterium]MDO8949127.1 CheR family methyltransferase [Actinomycetota bacterium]MDP3631537.1 CheR family methyltransferase [Actinomycetota bacterium]
MAPKALSSEHGIHAVNEEGLAKDLTLEEFASFRDFIHKASGIYLEEGKLDSLRISLVTRATRLGFPSFDDYYRSLSGDEREFNELMNLVTINETSFFRFPQQFEAFKTRVLPEIMAGKPQSNKTIRVWSAGCSTGEEPYSLGMALLDAGIQGLGWTPQVLGTDVSTRALALAQKGVYGRRAMLNVEKEVIARHFEPADESYRVTPQVRSLVDFGYHNLIKEPYPLSLMGNWDVIFCRNVTIYFRLESTRRVVSNFFNSLNPGGYLFIGHSETLSSISDDFEPVEIGGVFLYRKPKTKQLVAVRASRAPVVADRLSQASQANAETVKSPRKHESPAVMSAAVPPTDELIIDARRSLSNGHPERVLETVARILETDPGNAEAHLLSAYVHADSGDYVRALEACHRALSINPLLPVARYILGIIYQRQGDPVRAVSELKKTIYIDAEFALAHLNLANIYKSQRKWEDAAREYENALRALYKSPEGAWTEFLGGFKADLLAKTCERSLLECRKAMGAA